VAERMEAARALRRRREEVTSRPSARSVGLRRPRGCIVPGYWAAGILRHDEDLDSLRADRMTAGRSGAGRGGAKATIRLKRAYEPAASSDGYRVLIDRLWPRGVSRERAKLDEWERELPPSTRLRQWFGHDPSRFEEFRRRYIEELRDQRPRLTELRRVARSGTLTLVYSARDTEHNDAVVLAEILRRGLPKAGKRA
jgi:uncharacterized protein YeaO (DUF488 family)